MLGIALTADGFWQEADSKWRPVDSGREGSSWPASNAPPPGRKEAMRERRSAGSAGAAPPGQRGPGAPEAGGAGAARDPPRCELCIQTCPYAARYKDLRRPGPSWWTDAASPGMRRLRGRLPQQRHGDGGFRGQRHTGHDRGRPVMALQESQSRRCAFIP
ncbi:MAG: hypothetical protein MZU91_14610 [Desulfosudis oleivorans]|nr:hypothetical protein [Desulfosudis oleivorans]